MHKHLTKTLSAIGLCSAGLAANVFADQMDQQQYPMTGRDRQEITPPAGPRVTEGADVFVTLDFIWWKPREDGLGYATTGHPQLGANPVSSRGKVYRPNTKYQPGFKVGLGLDFDHDGWDLYANYTWLSSKKFKSSISQPGGTSTIEGLWFTSDDAFAVSAVINDLALQTATTAASGNWRLRYNVFDLELGRNFFVSKYLAVRLHGGLKFSWQRQNYNIAFSGQVGDEATRAANLGIPFSASDYMKQRFWGVGIRTGVDNTFYMSKEWSIFANMAVSALWSQFKDDRKKVDTGIFNTEEELASGGAIILWNRNKFYTLTPALEFELGIRWETWFSDDQYHIALDAGYEQQVWFDMNQFFNEWEQGNHGKLSLDGLTIRARFDF